MSFYNGTNNMQAKGFTLIELMIGMTIGLFLLAGIIKVFSGMANVSRVNNDMAQVADNIRATTYLLDGDIKQTAYATNCAQLSADRGSTRVHFTLPVNSIFRPHSGVNGFEFTGGANNSPANLDISNAATQNVIDTSWRPRLPVELMTLLDGTTSIRPVFGSDVLVVRYALPITDVTITFSTQNTVNLGLGAANYFNTLIRLEHCSDLDENDVFLNTSNAATAWRHNSGLGWTVPHRNSSQRYQYIIRAFFVGFDSNTGNNNLYRYDYLPGNLPADRQAIPLLEGVENIQLRYRVNTLDANAGFVTAEQVENWAGGAMWGSVDAVELSMMYQSLSGSGARYSTDEKNNILTMGGGNQRVVTSATDGRYRQIINHTVAIRNRLFAFPGDDRFR